MKNERRKFLKKAAYAAPVMIAMGQLAKPTNAHADTSEVACTPDHPDWPICGTLQYSFNERNIKKEIKMIKSKLCTVLLAGALLGSATAVQAALPVCEEIWPTGISEEQG